jgi:hypothetical protein
MFFPNSNWFNQLNHNMPLKPNPFQHPNPGNITNNPFALPRGKDQIKKGRREENQAITMICTSKSSKIQQKNKTLNPKSIVNKKTTH